MALRIAIIGGVAGGAGAAAAARRANEQAEIALFEAGPYISFANCGLPYYLSREIESRDKLLVTSPELMRQRFNVDVRTRHEVLAINRERRTIRVRRLADGVELDHPYDRLVVATGARPFKLHAPGLDHPRVAECRTLDDTDRLSALANAHPGGRALVIGGGFIGIEVVEALTKRGMKVNLVEAAPQILPPLDPEIAAAGRIELEKHGVSLHPGVTVERFEHGPGHSEAMLANGLRIAFDLAVVGVGASPETSIAKAAGLAIGSTGGLVVDEYQRTSDPTIFAAGDVTELFYWPTHSRLRLALAGPANKQARVAGANAASREPQLTTSGAAGTSIVRVFGMTIGMTGLSEKVASTRKIAYRVVYSQSGHHAGYFPGARSLFIKLVYSPEDGRILGGQVFGEAGVDKRIDVLATAIHARFTVDQLADLDLAYAPPFGSAKDPLIIAGMVASNAFHGRTDLITPRELAEQLASADPPVVLDVRDAAERAAGCIGGSLHLPVDKLRDSLAQLPGDRPMVVHCAVGYRGYLAERILRQRGFVNVRNLTGGFRAWTAWQAANPLPAA